MSITKAALLALRGLDKEGRERVALAMNISPVTLYTWIKNNHDNLTKAANLQAISNEIGLPVSEILEKEESKVKEEQN